MRRKSRELNIFSMSALDLFASALGAFILITLILLPYYLQQGPREEPVPQDCPVPEPTPECPIAPECPTPEPVPECPVVPPTPPCPTPEPVPECPVCPPPTPVPECPPPTPATVKIADNLLVMQMSWSVIADVDMHVRTPNGEYFYRRVTIPGAPGRFTLDNRSGGTAQRPALEIWMAYNPTPGDYEICYNLFNYDPRKTRLPVRVKGRLDKPHGPVNIPVKELRVRKKIECVLKFTIDNEYNYTQIYP